MRKKIKTEVSSPLGLYFRVIALLLAVSIIFFTLAACKNREPKRYSQTFFGAFDTAITMIAYCDSQGEFNRYADYAQARFIELHQLYDRYNSYEGVNNIYRINHEGLQQALAVEQELLDLLELAKKWQREAPPAVNIALGAVLELWHDTRTIALEDPSKTKLPTKAELETAAQHISIDDLILDHENKTVFLADPLLRLDLGAVAKGYATEIVTRELLEQGLEIFIISSGGNVRAAGAPQLSDRDSWYVGIQDPQAALSGDQEQILYTLKLEDKSVVTSGDYQRYFLYEGRRYHHIIDPATLAPAQFFTGVTVVTTDSGWADFLSTTLFILPYQEGLAFVQTLEDVEVIWIFADGSVKMTPAFSDLFKEIDS